MKRRKEMGNEDNTTRLIKSAYKRSCKSYSKIQEESNIPPSLLSKIINGKMYASLAMYIKLGKSVGLEPQEIVNVWRQDKINHIEKEIEKALKAQKIPKTDNSEQKPSLKDIS
jgi:plasmid maintenance system antidote protein VapI